MSDWQSLPDNVVDALRNADIACPPYQSPKPLPRETSILALASRASDAANRFRDIMEVHKPIRDAFRAARALADATDALSAAIADAVAEGDSTISLVS